MEGFKGPWAKWKQFCREGGGGREGGQHYTPKFIIFFFM